MKEKKYSELFLIPMIMLIPLIISFSWNSIVYFGSRLIAGDWNHFNAELPIDRGIPFVSWTVFFYLSCYLFWGINYIIGCRQSREEAFKFISADFFAKTVCLFFFLVFPTTNTRPFVPGNNIWEKMVLAVYTADAADNLFPSIHCLTSWFCYIAVRKNSEIGKIYKLFSLFYALAVCISTLTTKQHVIIDLFGGILLAEGSYRLVDKIGFSKFYEKVIMKLNKRIGRFILTVAGRR